MHLTITTSMGSCLDNIRKITNDSLIHRRSLKILVLLIFKIVIKFEFILSPENQHWVYSWCTLKQCSFINHKRWVYERFPFRRITSNTGDIKSLIDSMPLLCSWDVLWNHVMLITNFDIDKWASIDCSGSYW